jgi:hypothetical protein
MTQKTEFWFFWNKRNKLKVGKAFVNSDQHTNISYHCQIVSWRGVSDITTVECHIFTATYL